MKRPYIYLLISIAAILFLTGFDFFNDPRELDPHSRVVYRSTDIAGVIGDIGRGEKDPNYAVSGKIDNIGKKYDVFRITGSKDEVIECRTSEIAVKNAVADLSNGDTVTVYGEFRKNLIGGGISGKILDIKKGEIEKGDGILISGGKIYNSENTRKETIVNKRNNGSDIVTFRVPKDWERVEKELDSKGDHIYGYQYRLNRIRGSAVPESLYVFYFDYNKNLTDKSRYDEKEKIEAAIVRNILSKKDAGKCPESVVTSPYGPVYHYYDDKYESGDDVYHLEFVFRSNGQRGMLVYMYIYRLPERVDEIMYVMRTTEIKEES